MKFVTPEVELIKLEAIDVIAVSGGNGGDDEGNLPTDEWE